MDTTMSGNGEDGVFGAVEPNGMLFIRSTIADNGGHGIANLQWIADRSCNVQLVTGSASVGNGTLADCGIT